MSASGLRSSSGFFGRTVVWGAFTLAVLGWGTGFYGPPVYLHAVVQRTGWSVSFVSGAVTLHFVAGALVIACLATLYKRWGIPRVTRTGSIALALGVVGWSLAAEPWQLALAAVFSGGGWVTMGAAAINAIVSPWFVRRRAPALSTAYNGSSIGGVVFSPLWATLIPLLTFPCAAALVGAATVALVWILSARVFSQTPAGLGQLPDGGAPETAAAERPAPAPAALPGRALWRNRAFLTLAGGMLLGLFAQVGLLAHLYSVLVPVFGRELSGFAMGLATACALTGRTAVGYWMPPRADRRLVSCAGYAIQALGSLLLLFAAGNQAALLGGIVLFGLGIGNATSLPPLIAQQEFTEKDVSRIVPLCVAIAQGGYAFAPAVFGLLRMMSSGDASRTGALPLFAVAAAVQVLAIVCFLAGRGAAPSLQRRAAQAR